MKVLMITGDKTFGPGHPRYELQRGAVERLEVLYWGRGTLLPKLPKGPFDIITAQDPFIRGHLAAHLAWWYGCNLNIQVHTDLSAYSSLKRWWAGFNLRKATSVRVVSEKIKEQVVRMGITVPVCILPVFVDLDRFKAVAPRAHEQKTILWVGRFEEEKDPLLAISVFAEVLKKIPNAKLIMVGKGSLDAAVAREANTLLVEHPIDLPGWQTDITKYLAVADVVLCTSKHESWGASIVEALAAGVPVVAPDVGIAKEAGAIVVPREELAEAVIDVLTHPREGQLKLSLRTADAWAQAWRDTLA